MISYPWEGGWGGGGGGGVGWGGVGWDDNVHVPMHTQARAAGLFTPAKRLFGAMVLRR